MRILIVDDEDLARAILREYLAGRPDIEIVGECANGFDAVKMIAELKPDLALLDVQMPKLDGFEILELVQDNVAVIFVTAYDSYALRAFDVHAVDYLLKPFTADRLYAALDRARLRVGDKPVAAADLAAAARPPDQYLERVAVRDGSKVHIIPVHKLDYVEAQDDYVSLASGGRKVLKQQTISSLERGLDPAMFLRIHRSVIVNVERVAKIEPYTKDTKLAILRDGTRLPVSRSGYQRLREFISD